MLSYEDYINKINSLSGTLLLKQPDMNDLR